MQCSRKKPRESLYDCNGAQGFRENDGTGKTYANNMKINNSSMTLAAIGAVSLLSFASAANAQLIINPTLNSYSNDNTDTGNFNVNNMTNQKGLSSPVQTGDTLASAQATTFNGDFGGKWGTRQFAAGGTHTFVYDLGVNGPISNLILWQYIPTGQGNNTKDFNLRYSDTTTFTGGPDFSGTLSATANPQTFDLNGAGQFVEFSILSNYGGQFPGGDRTGLGKVRFAAPSAAATPEPGSITLLVGMGIAGVGVLRRRKYVRFSGSEGGIIPAPAAPILNHNR